MIFDKFKKSNQVSKFYFIIIITYIWYPSMCNVLWYQFWNERTGCTLFRAELLLLAYANDFANAGIIMIQSLINVCISGFGKRIVDSLFDPENQSTVVTFCSLCVLRDDIGSMIRKRHWIFILTALSRLSNHTTHALLSFARAWKLSRICRNKCYRHKYTET